MTRAKKALSQAVLLISGAIMLGFGAMRGEVETVLSKASYKNNTFRQWLVELLRETYAERGICRTNFVYRKSNMLYAQCIATLRGSVCFLFLFQSILHGHVARIFRKKRKSIWKRIMRLL